MNSELAILLSELLKKDNKMKTYNAYQIKLCSYGDANVVTTYFIEENNYRAAMHEAIRIYKLKNDFTGTDLDISVIDIKLIEKL